MPTIAEDSATGVPAQSSGQSVTATSGPPPRRASELLYSQKKAIPYLRRGNQPVYVFLNADSQIANDHRDRFADLKDILQRNAEKCRKLYDCLADISYELRVCGTDESNALPAILITCPKHKAKRLQTIIEQPHVQNQCKPANLYPELQIVIWAEPMVRRAFGVQDSDDMDEGVAPFSPQTLCGVQVIYDKLECRKSTVACLVSVQGRRFALTTAHALRQSSILPAESEPAEGGHIESRDEDEMNLHTSEDRYDFPEDETLGSLSEEAWAQSEALGPEIIAEGHAIYQAPTDTTWTNSHPDLDWLLLELNNPSQWLPNIWLGPDLGNPISLSSVSIHSPSKNREVLILSSRGPAIHGMLRSIPSHIGGTRSSPTSEVWTVRLEDGNGMEEMLCLVLILTDVKIVIRRGDSGSLVIDASDHKVYGQVIASSPLEDVYVVPLKDILHQIEEVFQEGNVSLQASHAQAEEDSTSNTATQASLNDEDTSLCAASAPPRRSTGQTLETLNNDSTWIISELQCLVHSMTEALKHQDLQKVSEILKTLGQQRIITEFQSLVHSTEPAHKRHELQDTSRVLKNEGHTFDDKDISTESQPQVLTTSQKYGSEDLLQNLDRNRFSVISVPIAENTDFIGRQKELDALREKLVLDHKLAGVVSCALHGIAGVGKTQTALRFLYSNLTEFDAIFWVSADPEQKSEIDRTFCNIGLKLKLFKGDETDDAQIEAVYTWLQTTGQHFFHGLSFISWVSLISI